MKHYSLFALLIFVLSLLFAADSYASKARMDSLGGEERARYYFDDSRNILINPAYINIVKDFLIFEWGNDTDSADSGATGPKGEGGVYKSGDFFIYGIYLGNEDGHSNRALATSGTNSAILYQDNPVELFIGGNLGNEWGASIKISQNHDEQGVKKTQQALSVKFGTIMKRLEGYVNVNIYDKSLGGVTTSEEFRNDLAATAGASYIWSDFIFYSSVASDGHTYRRDDGQKDGRYTTKSLTVGGGRSVQVSERAKMFYDLHYIWNESQRDYNTAAAGAGVKDYTHYWKLPITFGLEVQAKDWLALRGAISQTLLSKFYNNDKKNRSERNTTNVNSGASLIFGKLKIEGLIGIGDNAAVTSGKKGVLSLGNVLTRTSITYSF
ncbi:MAG: hypothetical protein HQK50_12125 [Oligoflexia bacterium]|nr:hypothetical protein [Oligoflexia bacterium]MBF0366312.1 hypothetical protein [Oligoflexia bacterium]